jgi:hypothetical protein
VISKGFAILPMPKSRLRRTLRESEGITEVIDILL